MFKLLGRNIKKSISLFSVFFILILCFSIVSCLIEGLKQDLIVNNDFFSNKNITFQIDNTSNLNINDKDFMNIIKGQDGIILSKPESLEYRDGTSISGKSIFFNDKVFNTPPIVQGNFFTKQDFCVAQPSAVIGKNLKNLIIKKDNKEYFLYKNKYYEVIGIMGYKNKQSSYDSRFIVNLDSLISNDKTFDQQLRVERWQIDSTKQDSTRLLKAIYNNLNEKYNKKISLNILDDHTNYNPIITSLSAYKTLIIIFICILLVIISSIVNISLFWVYDMKKEVGIRKALGATNLSIIERIVLKYQLISLSSLIAALICYNILNKLHLIDIINPFSSSKSISNNIDILSLIAIFIFSIVIGLITALVPVKQILQMEANDIIRGR